MQLPAILGVSMNDIFFQRMHSGYRVVPIDHHQISRVQIDGYAGRMKTVQKTAQHRGRFRTGLHSKMSAQRVGVTGQFAAGVLHDAVAGMFFIRRHHADMRGHNVSLHFQRNIQNALGFFHQRRVQLRVAEALAQIAAQGGEAHAMILDHVQNVLALCGGHFSFGQLGGRSVYLQPFGSQLCGRVYRFGNGFTEGFQNNADGKLIHRCTSEK